MVGKIVKAALAAALVLTVAGAAPAGAKAGDVIKRGSCSASSDWKLKLSPEDNGIEVEFEVDSNRSGANLARETPPERRQDLRRHAQDRRGERLVHGSQGGQ